MLVLDRCGDCPLCELAQRLENEFVALMMRSTRMHWAGRPDLAEDLDAQAWRNHALFHQIPEHEGVEAE